MEPQCIYCNLVDKHRCRNEKKALSCQHYLKHTSKSNNSEIDFGFSFEDEDTYSYEVIDNERIQALENKVKKLYQSIEVFLDNLCRNPEKPIINWPDRVSKIQEFKNKLKAIIEEEK